MKAKPRMYMTRVSLVTGHAGSDEPFSPTRLRGAVLASADEQDGLEHAHVSTTDRNIDITLFVQAMSQPDADDRAARIVSRVCDRLPGWRIDAPLFQKGT